MWCWLPGLCPLESSAQTPLGELIFPVVSQLLTHAHTATRTLWASPGCRCIDVLILPLSFSLTVALASLRGWLWVQTTKSGSYCGRGGKEAGRAKGEAELCRVPSKVSINTLNQGSSSEWSCLRGGLGGLGWSLDEGCPWRKQWDDLKWGSLIQSMQKTDSYEPRFSTESTTMTHNKIVQGTGGCKKMHPYHRNLSQVVMD
jgi:hypothetical protein